MDHEDPWHQRSDIKLTVTLSQLAQRRQTRELIAARPRGSLNLAPGLKEATFYSKRNHEGLKVSVGHPEETLSFDPVLALSPTQAT